MTNSEIVFNQTTDIQDIYNVINAFLDLSPGIRHFAMLKLTGVGDKASGTVQLFPLNGESCGAVQAHGTVMEKGIYCYCAYEW